MRNKQKVSIYIVMLLLVLQSLMPTGLVHAEGDAAAEPISIATVTNETTFKQGQDIIFDLIGSEANQGQVVITPTGLTQTPNENANQFTLRGETVGQYQVSFEAENGQKSQIITIDVVPSEEVAPSNEENPVTEPETTIPPSNTIQDTVQPKEEPKNAPNLLENKPTVATAGIQPKSLQTTMVGSPNPVTSRGEVVLDISVSADAGDLKPENGKIVVMIPRDIVYASTDLSNIVLPAPFVLESVQGNATDFIVTISIDFTNIDPNDAFYGDFQLKFGAPLLREGDNHQDSYDVNLDYAGQQIQDTLQIKKDPVSPLPNFDKWGKGKKDANGIYLLDKDVPSSINNTFQLRLKATTKDFYNVVDTLPTGTTLEDPALTSGIVGDSTPNNHVRIIRVLTSDPVTGSPIKMEYASDEHPVKFDPATNQLSVDFRVLSNETYLIEYGTKVVDPNMGVQYNQVTFNRQNSVPPETRTVPVRVSDSSATNFIFSKSVDKKIMNYGDTTLDYTLKMQLLSGASIPAGTEFVDQLDSRLTFDSIIAIDAAKFDYTLIGNTLTFKTLQDIPVKELNKIVFRVDATRVQMGDKVENTMQTTFNGQTVHTGAAATKKYDGRIEIRKVDANQQPLSGATFDIRDSNQKVVYTGTTTATGILSSSVLPLGDYTVIETKAPDGYVLDATEKAVSITETDTVPVPVVVENHLEVGSVILKKVDSGNQNSVLANAVFNLLDDKGNVLKTDLTTGADGKIQVDSLAPGNYSFVETKAPTGYKLDATPIAFEIIKNQQQPLEVVKTNELKTSNAVLIKVDAASGAVLSGAEFELQTTQGTVVKTGLVTDQTGKISVQNLAIGNYQWVEVKAPTGYELDATPVVFEVVGDKLVESKKTNALILGNVVLNKIDEQSKKGLAGAEFKLQDSQGKTLSTGLVSDQNGKIAVNDLTPGNYQFVETKAPTSYQLDATPIKFEIVKNQQKPIEVTKTNKLKTSLVTLTKVDEDSGTVLAGAEFELQTEQGDVVQKGLITDRKGQISVQDLAIGRYQFVEVKAPTGYILDATPVSFEVVGEKAVETKKVNSLIPGSVVLAKIDEQTKKTLAGAEFMLQDEKGKMIARELKTDQNGVLKVADLKPGNYQFIETKAPNNYELDGTPLKFTIEKNQQTPLKVTKTNHLIGVITPPVVDPPNPPISVEPPVATPESPKVPSAVFPQTGEKSTATLMGIGIALVLGNIGFYTKKRRKTLKE
ncbi:MSCRAMM family protein [Carnobacterium gallinarum]|uniref:MSCRAMM family protein n=1 Tax=Carnobacterium gallinarum TaxID=2749 RepID=UPI0006912953|nr:SpaA isopeptide-forming pilin-related protein [Carnobacterium gallinarum]